jgi:hypothetical protein
MNPFGVISMEQSLMCAMQINYTWVHAIKTIYQIFLFIIDGCHDSSWVVTSMGECGAKWRQRIRTMLMTSHMKVTVSTKGSGVMLIIN